MTSSRAVAALGFVLLAAGALVRPVSADEGMWTFDNVPAQLIGEKYGFAPDARWLEHVRLSSLRLAGGCSASFVSPDGLVMTNHHCAQDCIEQLSTARRDYFSSGFNARTQADELRCPEMELNQLVAITDVTEQVTGAAAGKTGEAAGAARRSAIKRIEAECTTGIAVRCDVVTLYQGGQYHLYRYRRIQDVRLVFAPEFAIAFFGGDPDNFEFPRYDLDVTFLRAYDGGKPIRTEHYLRWSAAPLKDGDLTFVSGHPGSTSRLETVAQLEFERDVDLQDRLLYGAEWRGALWQFAQRGAEQERVSKSLLFGVENGLKARRGRLAALKDQRFMARKKAEEAALRAKIAGDPKLSDTYDGAFEAIASAIDEYRSLFLPHTYVEGGRAFQSDLFSHARNLVRVAAERELPDDKRLREYTTAKLPELEQELFSAAPIDLRLETANLSFSLAKLRQELGPDHPLVRSILGPKSPEELAAELVKGTKLRDVTLRRTLYAGGKAAIAAANDPMIRFAEAVDKPAREVRTRYEDRIESVIEENGAKIARALFELYGTSRYPDATFSLRLSFGAVAGWEEGDRKVEPFTRIGSAFERHTGRVPFALPASWLAAKGRLDLETPFNFVTTNDIIGGNSGSPMIDRDARVVGLVFDGNIQSLGGDYWFDAALNRCVAVDARALMESLSKVYGADRIVQEIKAAAAN